MVYDGIVIGFVIGLLRFGFFNGLRALSNIRIRGGWIFPLLLVVQFVVYLNQEKYEFLIKYSGYMFMLVYVTGLVVLLLNRKEKGFWFILSGVFLNFLVMLVNGGKMPVSLEAASVLDPVYTKMLLEGTVVSKHILLNSSTHLSFLGDIIPLSSPYPRSQAISIGDIIMNFGIFIYLQHVMSTQKVIANSSTSNEQHIHNQNEKGVVPNENA
jgi:hypothetical protein